jgi:hypothetical protein
VPAVDREAMDHENANINVSPTSNTFWFKRLSHFRLFTITIFTADSDIFTLPAI